MDVRLYAALVAGSAFVWAVVYLGVSPGSRPLVLGGAVVQLLAFLAHYASVRRRFEERPGEEGPGEEGPAPE